MGASPSRSPNPTTACGVIESAHTFCLGLNDTSVPTVPEGKANLWALVLSFADVTQGIIDYEEGIQSIFDSFSSLEWVTDVGQLTLLGIIFVAQLVQLTLTVKSERRKQLRRKADEEAKMKVYSRKTTSSEASARVCSHCRRQ